MTEAEARAALRTFVGVGDTGPWIADRPWKAVAGGWSVRGELHPIVGTTLLAGPGQRARHAAPGDAAWRAAVLEERLPDIASMRVAKRFLNHRFRDLTARCP